MRSSASKFAFAWSWALLLLFCVKIVTGKNCYSYGEVCNPVGRGCCRASDICTYNYITGFTCQVNQHYQSRVAQVYGPDATPPPVCIDPAVLVNYECTCEAGSDYVAGVGCVVTPTLLAPLNKQSDSKYRWIVHRDRTLVNSGTATQSSSAVFLMGRSDSAGGNTITTKDAGTRRTDAATFGFCTALDPNSGDEVWSDTFGSTGSISSPSVTGAGGAGSGTLIVAGHADGSDGEQQITLWQVATGGNLVGPFVLPRGGTTHAWAIVTQANNVYVGGDTTVVDLSLPASAVDGKAASYVARFTHVGDTDDLQDPKWVVKGDEGTVTVALDLYQGTDIDVLFAVTTKYTAVSDTTIFSIPVQQVDAPSSTIMALDPSSGDVLWQIQQGNTLTSAAVNQNGDIRVAGCTPDGLIYSALLDGGNGNVLLTYDSSFGISGPTHGCAMAVGIQSNGDATLGGYQYSEVGTDTDAFTVTLSAGDGGGMCTHVMSSPENDSVTTVSSDPTRSSIVVIGLTTYGDALGISTSADTGTYLWASMDFNTVCTDFGSQQITGETVGSIANLMFATATVAAIGVGSVLGGATTVINGITSTQRYTSTTVGTSLILHIQGWAALKNVHMNLPQDSAVVAYFNSYSWVIQDVNVPQSTSEKILSITNCPYTSIVGVDEFIGNCAIVAAILVFTLFLHLVCQSLLQAHKIGRVWSRHEDELQKFGTSSYIGVPPPYAKWKGYKVSGKSVQVFGSRSMSSKSSKLNLNTDSSKLNMNISEEKDDITTVVSEHSIPASPSNLNLEFTRAPVSGSPSNRKLVAKGTNEKKPTDVPWYEQPEETELTVSEYSLGTYSQKHTDVAWMFMPFLELVVLIQLLQGISIAQASMLSSTCTPLAALGGILLVVPTLFLIFTAIIIRRHCMGNTSTLEYALFEEEEPDTRPLWKKFADGVSEGYENNMSIFSWSDFGEWHSRDGVDECVDAKAVRLGFGPLFADFNNRWPFFPCYMLIRTVAIGFVTSIFSQSNLILLALIGLALIFLVMVAWKKPFNNGVAGAAETTLLVADVISITVLFVANYKHDGWLGNVAMYIQLGFILLISVPLSFDLLVTMFSFFGLWRRHASAKLAERRQLKDSLRMRDDFDEAYTAIKTERRRRYRVRLRYIRAYIWPLVQVNAASFFKNIKNAMSGSLYGRRDPRIVAMPSTVVRSQRKSSS